MENKNFAKLTFCPDQNCRWLCSGCGCLTDYPQTHVCLPSIREALRVRYVFSGYLHESGDLVGYRVNQDEICLLEEMLNELQIRRA
jgi:hypothetical protein